MKKLLGLLSIFAVSAGAVANVGFLSTTGNNLQTNPAPFQVALAKQNILSNLDVAKIDGKGTKAEWEAQKARIINQLLEYNPDAKEGVDYNISQNENIMRLKSTDESFIDFDYSFAILADLNQLSLVFDLDDINTNKNNIELRISHAINQIAPQAVLGVDYSIEAIEYNEDGHVTNEGTILVSASEDSYRVSGQFNVEIIKNNEDKEQLLRRGTKQQGQEVLEKLIKTIHQWKPDAKEGIDYIFSYGTNGSWTLKAGKDPDVIFDDFTFTVITDLSDLSLTIEAGSSAASASSIKQQVDQIINNLVVGARNNIDYIVQEMPYKNGIVKQTGNYLVSATEKSDILFGSFNIKLVKHFNSPNYQKSGTQTEGEVFKQAVIQEIETYLPEATTFEDLFYVNESSNGWVIQTLPSEKEAFIFLGTISFDFVEPTDISILNLKLDVDSPNASKRMIEANVAELINNLVDGAKLGVDYTISSIPFMNGRPSQVGVFDVKSTNSSELIKGDFKITLTKTINTKKYLAIGSRVEGNETLNAIIGEIEQWNPKAIEGIDYEVNTTKDGSWTINSLPSSLVKVNFAYQVHEIIKVDISQIELSFDVDQATKSMIQSTVIQTISKLAPGAQYGIDYEIAPIPYFNAHPAQVGSYAVSTIEGSQFLTGSFNIELFKTIDTSNYDIIGLEADGQIIKDKIIAEIEQWNPYAVAGIDYEIIAKENNSWAIKSSDTSHVIVDFEYTVVADLSLIKEITFDINNVATTKAMIESTVASEIAKIASGAQLGVDYTIAEIPYNSSGRPTRVGRYEVKAVEGSKILTGKFNIRLIIKITPQEN